MQMSIGRNRIPTSVLHLSGVKAVFFDEQKHKAIVSQSILGPYMSFSAGWSIKKRNTNDWIGKDEGCIRKRFLQFGSILKENKADRHKSRAPSNQFPTDGPTDRRTDRQSIL